MLEYFSILKLQAYKISEMEESLVQVDRNTSAHLAVQWYKCIKKEDKLPIT